MNRALPQKYTTVIALSNEEGKIGVFVWDKRPDLYDHPETEAPLLAPVDNLKNVPKKITPKYVRGLMEKYGATKACVHHSFILSSDYWQQTSHPWEIREYHLVDGKIVLKWHGKGTR